MGRSRPGGRSPALPRVREVRVSRKYVLFLVILLALVGFDQITKFLVVDNIRYQVEEIPVFSTSVVNLSLVHVQNRGAAFGLFQNQIAVFVVFTIVAVVLLGYMLREVDESDRFQTAAIALIASGAVGNFIDRVHKQSVTDFVRIYTEHPDLKAWLIKSPLRSAEWPSWNVADAAIVVGLGMFLIHYLFLEKDAADVEPDPPREPLDDAEQAAR